MGRGSAGWKTGAGEECGVVGVAWRQEGRRGGGGRVQGLGLVPGLKE